jgi:hypothetical protein
MRAESLSDLYERVREGDEEMARALADAVTGDVPEIVRPAWLDRIIGIMPSARTAITAFGRQGLPDSGMEFNWPLFTEGYDGRVGVQATEKTEVTSKKIALESAKATIKTYAGGLDISYQLLKRSSPSFKEAALRILAIAWAIETEKAFATALGALTGKGEVEVPAAPTDPAAAIYAAVLEASAKVEDATGVGAEFVLAGSDAWLAWGSVLLPARYGTQNVAGVSDARSLRVEVSGLPVIRAKSLEPGAIYVSNGLTGAWHEDGPFSAEQDVIAKLGMDVAYWSLGAAAFYIPAGIVEVTTAAGA